MASALSRREVLAAGALAALAARSPAADRPPDILWLSCEDMSPHLGCWGDPHAVTPNLDRLAADAVRYVRAFTIAGVCAPSRSGIITGCYPTTLGSQPMRSTTRLPATVRCFPADLRAAGYYCTNNVKTDYNFAVPDDAWDDCSNNAHWRGRRPGQPFFAVFNLTVTHESQYRTRGEEYEAKVRRLTPAQRQDPDRLTTLPPYYPDTPETRRDWAHYLECITAMDYQVGDRLRELDEAGLLESTVIFFWSDHGAGLARAKRWPYDSGTHIPLIVRLPERLRQPADPPPGGVDGQLVSTLDLAPTVLRLAGLAPPALLAGRAFLGPSSAPPRRYVHAVRDRMDERYDCVRSVRDERFRYVRNYQAWRPYYQHLWYMEQGPTMRELRRLHAAGELPPSAEQWFAPRKPAEELYDTDADPHEQRNLAGQPEHAATLERLRAEHVRWQQETGDLGLLPESQMLSEADEAGTAYAVATSEAHRARLPRLREAVALLERGDVTALRAALADREPAVRWWASMGLGNLGRAAQPAAEALRAALGDASVGVRIAAARALGLLGQPALEVLTAELDSPNLGARVEAATALDELGEAARPALPALRQAHARRRDDYVLRLTEHALTALGAAP